MPAEAVKTPTPLSEANTQQQSTPKKKPSSVKTALAKITLLDGSTLDVTIDVSFYAEFARLFPFGINSVYLFAIHQRKAKGRDLLNSICAGLNILEKDYFGLLYSAQGDPRIWLDLDKPVAKFFKTDPWILQFAVKFYPPEPSQLQEDITRYYLCLQVSDSSSSSYLSHYSLCHVTNSFSGTQ